MKKLIKRLFSFLIIGIIFYFILRGVNIEIIWKTLLNINWVLFLVLCVFNIVSVIINAIRWQILLKPIKHVSFFSSFNATVIGYMFNNIIPFHLGELVRSFVIERDEEIKLISGLTTIFIEKIFDVIVLFIFTVVFLFFSDINSSIKYSIIFIGIISSILLIFLYIFSHKKSISFVIKKVKSLIPGIVKNKLSGQIEYFLQGFRVFEKNQQIKYIFLLSIVRWVQIALMIFIILKFININVDTVLGPILITILTVFATLIPSIPGYWGSIELAFIFGLSMWNVSKNDAFACSLIFHIPQYLSITLVGIIFLIKSDILLKLLDFNFLKNRQLPLKVRDQD
jgi:glycosyltransferase 2 family protein